MDNLQQTPTPTPSPTPTPKTNLGLIGSVLGFVGLLIFALPLGIAALILGIVDQPKNSWSYISIVMGIIDIGSALYLLSLLYQ